MKFSKRRMATMVSQASSSDTSSFERLHPKVQRWIWDMGWNELRDVQDQAIPAVLDGAHDVIISATTAAGKTEAAFLPVLSQIADRQTPGISVLYISPLKALINDQFRRLETLCEALEVGVVRWHGDAPQSAKQALVRNPQGIALITPESIEALLVRRPERAKALFADIDFIVIDELHAFLHSIRGLHLASLIRRVSRLSAKRPRIVGLSATIGDFAMAKAWVNHENPDNVLVVESTEKGAELKLQVRAYVDDAALADADQLESDEAATDESDPSDPEFTDFEEGDRPQGKIALDHIADHLFTVMRGDNNLVFAGSRRRVEALTDRLRRRTEALGIPNEFFAHHGSLSKEMREPLELRLKAGDLPTTAVATTTLELGIDVGSVKSVGQIGAPRSMSSLRQRLGRSGRREGMPAILRMYLRERRIGVKSHPMDRLRLDVVAAVASVVLLGRKYVEKPTIGAGAATAVLHQTLSVIAEREGASAADLYRTVCGAGPLSVMSQAEYIALLKHMGKVSKLIEQAPNGHLLLGETGERIVMGRDFYALFETDEEWRVVADGKSIGTLPMTNPAKAGGFIAFAGQRWKIVNVDSRGKIIEVIKDRSAKMPTFEPLGREGISDVFAAAMREVYTAADVPPYLDSVAAGLLVEARETFAANDLDSTVLWEDGGGVHIMTWAGTKTNELLALVFRYLGQQAVAHDIGITVVGVAAYEVGGMLDDIAARNPPLAMLTHALEELVTYKFDMFVPYEVLQSQWVKLNAEAYASTMALVSRLAVESRDQR
jgi:ATP-dependent Lhr-like helicase